MLGSPFYPHTQQYLVHSRNIQQKKAMKSLPTLLRTYFVSILCYVGGKDTLCLALLLIPCYRWENGGPEQLTHSLKVAQLIEW